MIDKYVPQELNISEAAVSRIDKLVSEEAGNEISLRIFVTGGGCSGFQYGFRLEDELDEESLDPNVRGSYFRFFIHNLIIFFH